MTPKETLRKLALENYRPSGVFNQETFDRDFSLFLTTKKMTTRFLRDGKLNERLLINNIVTALNLFGSRHTNAIFRATMDDVQFSVVKAILMFLHQYDFSIAMDVYPNRIIVDVLRDMQVRYNMEHV